ncbi:MAG: 30S ribosomal protein S27ae [Methanomicrobiales archaeon]|jgi:small subunit ribosomal protein S27Ae|nr:30S ribosomal protein S27ae [Methanomicrobiales archaeon]
MAAKKAKGSSEKKSVKRYTYYTVSGNTATTTKKYCPNCGPGVFLGEHKDRVACGKCGHTEFKE